MNILGHVRVRVRRVGGERADAGEQKQLGHPHTDGGTRSQGPDQDCRHVQPSAQPGSHLAI
jgi:hypothetical protein